MTDAERAVIYRAASPGESPEQVWANREAGWHSYVRRTYDPRTRTQIELNRDIDPNRCYPGERPPHARVRASLAGGELLRRGILREAQLAAAYPTAPDIDIVVNDAAFGVMGAHTLAHHGPGISLRMADASPGVRSIESRVVNGEGWRGERVPRSFRWRSAVMMNKTLHQHLHANWGRIRQELALSGLVDDIDVAAGEVVGEGFVEGTRLPDGSGPAIFTEGTSFTLRLRLIDGDPLRIVVVTFFPGP